MLYKSLILGVLFSIGIFAIKSGVGIAYVMRQQPSKRKIGFGVALFVLIYGLVFGLAGLILPGLNLMKHLAAIQAFIQSGMIVHLAMAVLMMGWGLVLLRGKAPSPAGSRGWLLLALPCPVCVTVIFLSAAFLIACFPDHPVRVVLGLYLAFVLISLGTVGGLYLFHRSSSAAPETFLGSAMLLISAYFLISMTLMPQFADLDKVYRLAQYHAETPSSGNLQVALLASITAMAFFAGYGLTVKKIRSLT